MRRVAHTEAVLCAGNVVADVVEDAAAQKAHDERHEAVHEQQRGVAQDLSERPPEQNSQLPRQRRPCRLLVQLRRGHRSVSDTFRNFATQIGRTQSPLHPHREALTWGHCLLCCGARDDS